MAGRRPERRSLGPSGARPAACPRPRAYTEGVGSVRRCLPCLLVALGLGGCVQSGSQVPVEGRTCGATCGRCGTGARSTLNGSGSGSSRAGSSSPSGSSGTSGSSSSSASVAGSTSGGGSSSGCIVFGSPAIGLFSCPTPPPIQGPPPGCTSPYFRATVFDLQSCGALCGATVRLLDPNDVPIAGASAPADPTTGEADVCLPGSFTYTPSASATGYPLFYYGEIQDQLTQPMRGLGMIDTATLSAFAGVVPGYHPGLAIIDVDVSSAGQCLNDYAGWGVSLQLPDGGAWPDGGYHVLYIDTNGVPNSALTATSSWGVAILGADPSISTMAELQFANADAGPCQPLNASIGFTGRLRIGADAVSVQAIVLP